MEILLSESKFKESELQSNCNCNVNSEPLLSIGLRKCLGLMERQKKIKISLSLQRSYRVKR